MAEGEEYIKDLQSKVDAVTAGMNEWCGSATTAAEKLKET